VDPALAARGRALSGAFLQLDVLTKRYGSIAAVHGLSLSVAQGEFLGVLGPSGCGKTTTLQMIAGFVAPDSGGIRLDGAELTQVPPARRNIGMVFQSYALFPHMTAAENVAFGLEMRRVPRAERAQRVAVALDQVQMAHLASRFPRQMSGGQQQRVALARALVIEPKLLLLDEPLSNLDANLREEMQTELRTVQRRVGITTVLVTHDQAEAMALCGRIAVMQAGRLVQVDAPWQAYESPADPFVADFLGRSNRLKARVDGAWGLVDGYRFPLPWAMPPGGAVLLVRPERLRLQPVPAHGTPEGLAGRVASRAFLGHYWLYQIETAAGTLAVMVQNTGAPLYEEGAPVLLDWDAASLRRPDAPQPEPRPLAAVPLEPSPLEQPRLATSGIAP